MRMPSIRATSRDRAIIISLRRSPQGKGTLAPWSPPRRLVVVGLYRVVRNPMYVAVFTRVLGWGLSFTSAPLALYALVLAIAFHLRVVLHEEPWLRQQFGADWITYAAAVPRWLPR
jgi:protein-S-isoprenylcysteine O-methyltransferase Ste14